MHLCELSFGKAHLFYPKATPGRCTAAFLLDVDPVGLVRSKRGQQRGPRFFRNDDLVRAAQPDLGAE